VTIQKIAEEKLLSDIYQAMMMKNGDFLMAG
jgi:hypothetical protein